MIYTTASDTYAVTDLSSFGRTLIDDATASAARTTLGLGSLSTASSINNDNWSGTDLAVANGGTGASTAGDARTNLGLVIGTDIPDLTGTNTYGATQTAKVGALTSGTSVSWDASAIQVATLELDHNATLSNPTNLVAGTSYALEVTQGSTGGTLAFDTAFTFPSGAAPVLSTGTGDVDVITFICFDGSTLRCTSGLDYS